MSRTLRLLGFLCLTAFVAAQDRVKDLLPKDARVIETATVPARSGKARLLVLWMEAPQRVAAQWDFAADFLYGDHWFGPALLSLIDASNGRLINTVRVRPYEPPENGIGFAVPFFTYNGPYYVPHPDKDRKGTPLLLHLQDLTGEGVAGQFVLFDHVVSGVAAGSVFGYSAKSDTAVQYPVETTQNKFKPVVSSWSIQVFGTKPVLAGYWKFTWEPGHGSWEWIDEEVHFDPAKQRFVEKITTRPYSGFAQVHCDLDTAMLTDFLGRMQRVASDEAGFKWLQGRIGGTSSHDIEAAGMVPAFRGEKTPLDLQFQSVGDGTIGIDFSADSDFAAALHAELRTWCGVR